MDNIRTEYTFLWIIENYSYCNYRNGEILKSPEFITDSLEGTAWCVHLYPRGFRDKDEGNISIFLKRSEIDEGPDDFLVNVELAILATDGSVLRMRTYEYSFNKGLGYGPSKIVQLNEALVRRITEYLPENNLSVRCKIWKDVGSVQDVKQQITARTRIGIEHISFLHVSEQFSALKPNEKQTVEIKSPSKNGFPLSSTLYFLDDSWCEGKIVVEITPSEKNKILSHCKIYLLDGSGQIVECCETDNRSDVLRKDIKKMPLSLTRQVILSKSSKYLPDDKLSLWCECFFATGVEFERIERTVQNVPLVALNQISNKDQNKNIYNQNVKLSLCTSALDDFKVIYNNQLLADIELKTETKSFLAHKMVLCARSSIFKAMLTNDMKEKNTNCVEVNDLENDTVEQFLLFLYSDNITNLQWESAIKLYYAGDKYNVEKLKAICSSFLVHNVNTSSVSELLLLADIHNDSDLKMAAEDFIFKNEEQVYGSDEWINLIETNPVLVSKTMCLKYTRE